MFFAVARPIVIGVFAAFLAFLPLALAQSGGGGGAGAVAEVVAELEVRRAELRAEPAGARRRAAAALTAERARSEPHGTIGGPGSSAGGGSLNSTVPDRNTGTTQVPSLPIRNRSRPQSRPGTSWAGRAQRRTPIQRDCRRTACAHRRAEPRGRWRRSGAGGQGQGASGTGDGTSGSSTTGGKTPAKAQNGVDPHSMEECMKVWDPATHMTKEEWRVTCRRTLKTSPMDMLGTPW